MENNTTMPFASTSFDVYHVRIQGSALAATRKAAGLPADIAFHRSMDRNLSQDLDAFSGRVLNMSNRLLGLASTVDHLQRHRGKGKAKLESQDDVVDNFHSLVVDPMDQMLEGTDACLDEFLGRNKAPAVSINPPTTSRKPGGKKSTSSKPSTGKGRLEPVIQHAAHLSKPQLLFKKKIDNSDTPWYPTLSHKYNAKVPLGHVYTDPGAGESSFFVSNHPYRYEITHLTYPARIFTPCIPVQPPSLEETQATWVATKEDFDKMLSKLKSASEIAVDLEHHSYRSYSGFLCLMQISDREEDWVVDLLAVRDEVETLNEVFTDPEIVKVFHGAESDVVWLQQDFNIYVVNLFDTFQASKLLEFPRHGLANLLEMYCDFVPDKRYQLADWRIRPLPGDMLKYARSDTHFLLYIYDNLRNALLDRSQSKSQSQSPSSSPPPFASSSSSPSQRLLNEALARSAQTSLRVYAKECYDSLEGSGSGGWNTLAKRWNKIALTAGGPGVGIGAFQREVYKSVHGWRERVAREEDESTRFVLQNQLLFLMAEQPPADMASLLAMFKSSIPPVVKGRAKELLSVIQDAVKRGMAMTRMDGQEPAEEQPGLVEPPVRDTAKGVVMLGMEVKLLENDVAKETMSIWGPGQRNIPSTSRSLYFGSSGFAKSDKFAEFATSLSALFGSGSGSKIQASSSSLKTSTSYANHPYFGELVAKINHSFTMAPRVPQIMPAAPQTAAVEEKPEIDGASGMQVEIPYAAASQRPTKQMKEERDTIVVVGQARRKRKRKGAEAKSSPGIGDDKDDAESENAKVTAGKSAPKPEDVVDPFDFSAAPNILDDNPDLKDRKKKRQKKLNKGGAFYGDFPAPPKAHNELKSGNQSRTFK